MAKKVTVLRVPGIEKLSKGELTALYKAAEKIGIPVDWLATVISFETGGTFSPSVLNKAGSGAVGLIQFMPATAAALLKVQDKNLAQFMAKKMSFKEQLEKLVVPYFKGGTYNTLNDVYLKVFYPAAMNKASSYVVGSAPGAVYTQNAGFDKDNKGYITRADITQTISNVASRAAKLEPLTFTLSSWGQILAGITVSAAALYALRIKGKI
jgi:hypothetical protein